MYLALVKEVSHGQDGLVCPVRVRTHRNELVRPITKTILLEVEADSTVISFIRFDTLKLTESVIFADKLLFLVCVLIVNLM